MTAGGGGVGLIDGGVVDGVVAVTATVFLSFPTLVVGNPSFCFFLSVMRKGKTTERWTFGAFAFGKYFPTKDVGNDGGGGGTTAATTGTTVTAADVIVATTLTATTVTATAATVTATVTATIVTVTTTVTATATTTGVIVRAARPASLRFRRHRASWFSNASLMESPPP